MIVPRFIAGFSGHRDLPDPDRVSRGLQEVWRRLQKQSAARHGVLELYASSAYGADLLAVETARDLSVPVHLIVPKPVVLLPNGEVNTKAGFAADFWKNSEVDPSGVFLADEWNRASRQMNDAQTGVHGGTLRVTRGSQNDPECYYDAGLEVLECCDVLVAVANEQPARGLGGTRQMLEHARKLGLPIVLISPDTGAVVEERMELFASAKDSGCAIIWSLDEFSRSCAARDAAGEETATAIFARLDACSNQQSKHFRGYLVRLIVLNAAATLVGAVMALLPHATVFWKFFLVVMAFAEFCLIACALWQTRWFRKGRVHERWMQTRFAAELVRVLRDGGQLLDPLYPLVAQHDPAWRRFALTLGLLVRRERPPPLDWRAARDLYVANRLRHPDPAIGQISYYTRKQAEAEPHFQRAVRWGGALMKLALAFALGALLFKFGKLASDFIEASPTAAAQPASETAFQVFLEITFRFLPVVLPLAAGVLISLRSALDSGRRTFRYRQLSERLSAAATSLEALQTESSVRRTVTATEDMLLDELIEWRLAERQNGAK